MMWREKETEKEGERERERVREGGGGTTGQGLHRGGERRGPGKIWPAARPRGGPREQHGQAQKR